VRIAFSALWRQPEFFSLWVAQTVSGLGSQVTLFALPLTAILVLEATPGQVGLLTALGFIADSNSAQSAGARSRPRRMSHQNLRAPRAALRLRPEVRRA
jgi:hypothetical protein